MTVPESVTATKLVRQLRDKTVSFLHHALIHVMALCFRTTPSPRQVYLVALRMLWTNAMVQNLDVEEVVRDLNVSLREFTPEELAGMHLHYLDAAKIGEANRSKGIKHVIVMALNNAPIPEMMGLDRDDDEWMHALPPAERATSQDEIAAQAAHWAIPTGPDGKPYKN